MEELTFRYCRENFKESNNKARDGAVIRIVRQHEPNSILISEKAYNELLASKREGTIIVNVGIYGGCAVVHGFFGEVVFDDIQDLVKEIYLTATDEYEGFEHGDGEYVLSCRIEHDAHAYWAWDEISYNPLKREDKEKEG